VAETRKDLASSSLPTPIIGHAGDGNFHIAFVIDPKNPNEIAEVKRLNERLVQRALALGGTCTGEHGVGYGKMDFLLSEHGEAMTLMATLKRAIDPGGGTQHTDAAFLAALSPILT
jgi:D-lactate dehydrogenase (cytochrome)